MINIILINMVFLIAIPLFVADTNRERKKREAVTKLFEENEYFARSQ